jgi:PIN domain nuclease of toxin-antitoxin system
LRLLLDTCAFLWIIDTSERVPRRVIDVFSSSETTVYLSAVSSWEIAVKYAARRLMLAEPPERFVPQQRDAHGIAALPIDEDSALYGGRLPPVHRDPFDRLLIGQAIVHGLTIATPDPVISKYHVRTIW